MAPLNKRGTFFSLGHLNKKTQKVTVYPGAIYNIKIRTRSGLQVHICIRLMQKFTKQSLESSQKTRGGLVWTSNIETGW